MQLCSNRCLLFFERMKEGKRWKKEKVKWERTGGMGRKARSGKPKKHKRREMKSRASSLPTQQSREQVQALGTARS